MKSVTYPCEGTPAGNKLVHEINRLSPGLFRNVAYDELMLRYIPARDRLLAKGKLTDDESFYLVSGRLPQFIYQKSLPSSVMALIEKEWRRAWNDSVIEIHGHAQDVNQLVYKATMRDNEKADAYYRAFLESFGLGGYNLKGTVITVDPAFSARSTPDGKDPHRATAAVMFGVKEEDVTPDQRQEAKSRSFAMMYGQGPSLWAAEDIARAEENIRAAMGIPEEFLRPVVSASSMKGYRASGCDYHVLKPSEKTNAVSGGIDIHAGKLSAYADADAKVTRALTEHYVFQPDSDDDEDSVDDDVYAGRFNLQIDKAHTPAAAKRLNLLLDMLSQGKLRTRDLGLELKELGLEGRIDVFRCTPDGEQIYASDFTNGDVTFLWVSLSVWDTIEKEQQPKLGVSLFIDYYVPYVPDETETVADFEHQIRLLPRYNEDPKAYKRW